jgi:exodeoxyribonuclease X
MLAAYYIVKRQASKGSRVNIEDALLVIIDTETTGIPREGEPNEHEMLEVGLRFVDLKQPEALGAMSTLVAPQGPIPAEASAVHHLIGDDFIGAPPRDSVMRWLDRIIPSDAILVAHNAAYDRVFLHELGDRRWLCSYRLALHVWPHAPSHSNLSLYYWLGFKDRFRDGQAHRAGFDVRITEKVLRATLLEIEDERSRDVDEMIAWANSPAMLTRMPLGKYKGEDFSSLLARDSDYLRWITRQSDMRPDIVYTARTLLGQTVVTNS